STAGATGRFTSPSPRPSSSASSSRWCSHCSGADGGAARRRPGSMALYKAEAVVLRSRSLGEADKIVTLFTYERGKVEAVARGVRRPRSRLLGVTQLFIHGRFLPYERKSLDTISQGEIVRSFLPLDRKSTRLNSSH